MIIEKKTYYLTGESQRILYVDDRANFLHNEFGPANISYYLNGAPSKVEYYKHGKLHSEIGPARTFYHSNGNIILTGYYIDGELFLEEEFENHIKTKLYW